jgi:phosphatidylinositol-3-phosphatase
VPRFVWVTPNLCHSGHDCGPAAGGAWLSGFVASVTASPAWRNGGALVVTWDEGTDNRGLDPATGTLVGDGGGGNVLTLVIAPGISAGLKVTAPLDHYSLLRSIEDAFGLPLLREAGAPGTSPMAAFWS